MNMDILTLEDETTMLSQYLRHKSPSDTMPHPRTDTSTGSKLHHSLSRKFKTKEITVYNSQM
jgi:hypothetical protein